MKNQIFTTEEIEKARLLSYENWDREGEIGFVFHGIRITNPFLEDTGRFEFATLDAMYDYYGRENVDSFIKEILSCNSNI